MYNTDIETREREMYLERRKRELEIDMNRKFERMESEHKAKIHSDNTTWERIGNSSFTEVFCCVVVVIGAARLLGLI